MAIAKPGDTVQIHYTGTLDDGSQVDVQLDEEFQVVGTEDESGADDD